MMWLQSSSFAVVMMWLQSSSFAVGKFLSYKAGALQWVNSCPTKLELCSHG
jgi:hypothetical protein